MGLAAELLVMCSVSLLEVSIMEKLTLESLPQFDDGSVAIAVNQAITNCYHDCRDRPGMKTKRSVTIQIDFVPVLDPHDPSTLTNAEVTVQVNSKCPAKGVTKQVKCVPKKAGFGFNTDTDNVSFDPDQTTLPYKED